MIELIQAAGTGIFWVLIFFLWAGTINTFLHKPWRSGTGIFIAYPLFSFFQVFIVKLLDIFHLLNSRSIIVTYLITLFILLIMLSTIKRKKGWVIQQELLQGPDFLNQRIVFGFTATIFIFTAFISLLIPIHFFDDNTYHMPMVANYYQNHTLAHWATQCFRQITRPYVAELQMLHLAFLSHSDAWMELPNLLALFIILIITFKMAKQILGRTDLAFLAVALTLTARQILLIPATAANDAPFTAFVLGSFYCLIWMVTSATKKEQEAIAILIGLLSSLALGTKVMGICLFISLGTALTILALMKRISFKILVWFSLSGIFFTSILVGNIFWDNFQRFRIPFGVVPNEDPPFLKPSFLSVFNLYIRDLCFNRLVSTQNRMYGTSHYGYFFPLMLFLGTAKIIEQVRHSKKIANLSLWVLAVLSLVLFLLIVGSRQVEPSEQRFMIWIVPCLSILSLSFFQKGWKPFTVTAGISFCLAFALGTCFQTYSASFVGNLTRSSAAYFLKKHTLPRFADVFPADQPKLPNGPSVAARQGYFQLEQGAKESDWILYIGGQYTWMYPSWGRGFTRTIHGVSGLDDAIQKIRSGKYRFVILERSANITLRDNALRQVKAFGYRKFVKTDNRIIVQKTIP